MSASYGLIIAAYFKKGKLCFGKKVHRYIWFGVPQLLRLSQNAARTLLELKSLVYKGRKRKKKCSSCNLYGHGKACGGEIPFCSVKIEDAHFLSSGSLKTDKYPGSLKKN